VRAQEFVRQIAVAVFDVDEIKTCLVGREGGTLKVFNDLPDVSIPKQGIVVLNA
jgi:hypothetical protein